MANKKVGNFRSNLFGGFNRKDVVDYIKQLHDKLTELEEDNEFLLGKLNSLESSAENQSTEQDTDHLSEAPLGNVPPTAFGDISDYLMESTGSSEKSISEAEPDSPENPAESVAVPYPEADTSESAPEQNNCDNPNPKPDTATGSQSPSVVSVKKPASTVCTAQKVQIRRSKKR